jgi:hypothetical protein
MKRGITMNKWSFAMNGINKTSRVFCLGALVLALLTCEQPFKGGLGPVVDFRPPAIILDSPYSGDFISGEVLFEGHVDDDYKVESVHFRVTSHREIIGEGRQMVASPYLAYQQLTPNRDLTWSFTLDTRVFEDGIFKLQLLARDSSGKTHETDEIAFTVKNKPPSISMTMPAILQATEDENAGRLGGTDLNYRELSSSDFPRVMDSNGLMVGLVTDSEGVYMDAPAGGKFPPQIRFWEVPSNANITYPFTSEDDGWRNLEVLPIGLSDVMIRFALPSGYDKFFAFEIRAYGLDGTKFTFPRDYWAASEQGGDNRAAVIWLTSPEEYPTLNLWRFQDIATPVPYGGTYTDLPGLANVEYHKYIDNLVSGKNGAFTLRVRADHSWGINSAVAYFEREGRDDEGNLVRGRLIWDPASTAQYPLFDNDTYRGNTVSVASPYYEWGLNDPSTKSGVLDPTTRSFVFTYLDDGTDRTDENRYPNTPIASIPQATVRNRSKVQLYSGENWGKWDDMENEVNDAAVWAQDLATLPEGTYTIRIIARAANDSYTSSVTPLSLTVSIDKRAPEIGSALTSIDGAYRDTAYTGEEASYTVNGVIRPRFSISESRGVDSGFRTATANYFRRTEGLNTFYGYEQFYVLVPESHKSAMDAYAASGAWPQVPASSADPWTLPGGIPAAKHGPIVDSSCRFKTTKIYGGGTLESDVLTDNATYWLYVFARDNAFNIGHHSYRLHVDASSDNPTIDALGSVRLDASLADPNAFTANSAIRLRLEDDDSLDLGTSSPLDDPSSVVISFVGSTFSGNSVVARDETDPAWLVKLDDAQIKQIFAPQNMETSSTRFPARERRDANVRIDNGLLRAALDQYPNYNYLTTGVDAGRLPDGLYYFIVSVTDYNADPNIKLIIPGANSNAPAEAKTTTHKFWVRVDNKGPEITGVTPVFGYFIADFGLYGGGITGIVSDENGPVTVVDSWVEDNADPKTPKDRIPNLIGTVDLDSLNPGNSNQSLWSREFLAPVQMGGRSGTYDFFIVFQDSYGNSTRLHVRYSIDGQPPTVILEERISTFSRNYPELTLTGANASTDVNKTRLANKVIHFKLAASDNFRVDGVHWWLLRSDYGSNGGTTPALYPASSYDGLVVEYEAYPSSNYAADNDLTGNIIGNITNSSSVTVGKFGKIYMGGGNFDVFIDTQDLSEGEYRLHVIAKDMANMFSRESPTHCILQEIFIMQEEDKPYFVEMSPADGSVHGQMLLRGVLHEDDAFGPPSIADPFSAWPDTVNLYLMDGDHSGLDVENQSSWGAHVTIPIPTGPTTFGASGLSLQRDNLVVDVNIYNPALSSEFQLGYHLKDSIFEFDGPKTYILEVWDAPLNKYLVDGTADTTRVYRRKAFTFIYDRRNPEIVITHPAPGQAFGPSAGTEFYIEGYIADENLKQVGPDPVITYRWNNDPVDPQNPLQVVLANGVPPGMVVGTGVFGSDNVPGVSFKIPADYVTTTMKNFTTLAEGSNNRFQFTVEDKSGKKTSFTVPFVKDQVAPDHTFTTSLVDMRAGGIEWWDTGNGDQTKWDWLQDNPVPVIHYDSGVPYLSGAFNDVTSDIDIGTLKYWIDGQLDPPRTVIAWDGSGKNYNWTIPLTVADSTTVPLNDGVHTIEIEVLDRSGNKLYDTKDIDGEVEPHDRSEYPLYAFRISNSPPSVELAQAVASPPPRSVFGSSAGFTSGTVFTLNGTASGPNLKEVHLQIESLPTIVIPALTADGNTLTPIFSNPNTVDFTWAYHIDAALYAGFANGQTYRVSVTAVDHYGNTSEQGDDTEWSFTKDAASPVLSFIGGLNVTAATNLNPTATSGPTALTFGTGGTANLLETGTLTVKGRAEDANSPIKSLQRFLEQWNWSTNSWQAHGSQTLGNWVDFGDFEDQLDYPWELHLAGGGENIIDDGLYRLRIRAKDSSWTQIGTNPDGLDPVWSGTDVGNPVYSSYVYFYYDRGVPSLEFDPMEMYYSSAITNNQLVFRGTASDPNRVRSLSVSVLGSNNNPVNSSLSGHPATLSWDSNRNLHTWEVTLPMNNVNSGNYNLSIAAADYTGKANTNVTPLRLDNKVPEGGITTPAKATTNIPGYPDASRVVMGGEEYKITGWSDDTSTNNSESGMAGIWYHLGFLDGSTTWPDVNAIRNSVNKYDSIAGPLDNPHRLFDYAASYSADTPNDANGNAWFKLGGTPVPEGCTIEGDIFSWTITVGASNEGLKAYTKPIWIKGRQYNNNGQFNMVSDVPEETGFLGLKRMPLWVRMADIAGNVTYECRDIWIFPDGDIPILTITSPNTTPLRDPITNNIQRRGGAISAYGNATNNLAIQSVIFRVKVDAVQNSTPPANDNGIVPLMGPVPLTGTSMDAGMAELSLVGSNTTLSTNGWYFANLEASPGEMVMPWNFSFNTAGEISETMIEQHGFASGGGQNDTVRVWVEVAAFRRDGQPPQATTISEVSTRYFYLKIGAPKIGPVMIISNNTGDDTTPHQYRSEGGEEKLRGSFTIEATLDAAENMVLSEVLIARRGESNSSPVTAWKNGISYPSAVPGFNLVPGGYGNQFHTLQYTLDSTSNLFRGGDWATSGGRYPITIIIRDQDNPPGEAQFDLDIGIDNFAPVAHPTYETRKSVAGTNEYFQGRNFDRDGDLTGSSTMPSKIQTVYAWFLKNIEGDDYFINIDGNRRRRTGSTSVTGTMTATGLRSATLQLDSNNSENVTRVDIDNPGSSTTVNYPATSSGLNAPFESHASGWVREISALSAQPGSRMIWSANGGHDYDVTWQFNIDTTALPDGPLYLDYIVVDEVGNASYYRQGPIVVRNNYPVINSVTLYTDNNGLGMVYSTGSTANIASQEFTLDTTTLGKMRGTATRSSTTLPTSGTPNAGVTGLPVSPGPGETNLYNEMRGFGYLNSGFYSRNQYVGFRVESLSGNSPLKARLQYVTRELVHLTDTNLADMITARDDPDNINLYTIAWDGGYSSTRWEALGVPISDPPLGTHFVLTAASVPPGYPASPPGWVWKYTSASELTKETLTLINKEPLNSIYNRPVKPNDSDWMGMGSPPSWYDPGDGFNFAGTDMFDPDGTDNTKIGKSGGGNFLGSQPDLAMQTNGDNPDETAFFLIRIWDSVDPDNSSENAQLFDAVVIGMNVYLKDTTVPTIRLYDLNPYTEEAVVQNNNSDYSKGQTILNALNPTLTGEIGQNILRGGLYNTSTQREQLVKSGHIEPKNGTRALMPMIISPFDTATHPNTNTVYGTADGYVVGDGPVASGVATNTYIPNGGVSFTVVPRDLVSGSVILRGQAYDNQLIREIRVHVGTGTVPSALTDPGDQTYTILKLDKTSSPSAAIFRTLQPVPGKNARAFESLDWKNGHVVEWAYIWNTEDDYGEPTDDVRIWVAAIDDLGGATYTSDPLPGGNHWPGQGSAVVLETEDDVKKNTFSVDIVPYVTGFQRYGFNPGSSLEAWKTEQPRSAAKRSLQGWYSFYQEEANIAAVGYNLKGSDDTEIKIKYGNNPSVTTPNLADSQLQDKNLVVFNVPHNAQSGKITLFVDGTDEALNHRTDSHQSWNKEAFSNTPGSNLWVNKPYAHIWRSQQPSSASGGDAVPYTYFATGTQTQGTLGLDHPGMTLEYHPNAGTPGRLWGSWTIYATAGAYSGWNNGGIRHHLRQGLDEPWSMSDISMFQGRPSSNTAVSATYKYDGAPRWRYFWNLPITATDIGGGAGDGQLVQYNDYTPTERWQNGRVVAGNDGGTTALDTFMTMYDAQNRTLWYARYNAPRTIDGGSTGTAIVTGTASNVKTSIPRSDSAGEFSAIDYVTNGSTTTIAGSTRVPIIAYQDSENDTVRIALAGTANPGTGSANGNDWFRQYLLPAGHPLFRGSGRYISMKVDKANGVHLAFYNSAKSAIVYAYIKDSNAIKQSTWPLTPSDTLIVGTTNFYVAIVDNVVKGGTWTDISVDDHGNPWIVYGDTTRTGNTDGARIAYRSSAQTGIQFGGGNPLDHPRDLVTGSDIDGWEAVQVPSKYKVIADRLNIEVWPPTNRSALPDLPTPNASIVGSRQWRAAVGYAGADGTEAAMYRIAYFYYPEYRETH